MNLEVLLSCVNQSDYDLINRSKITSDVVMINQCDKNEYEKINLGHQKIKFVSTSDKGLSKSRNLAIKTSIADICIVCDDDEIFIFNYEEEVKKAYSRLLDADVIIFNLKNTRKKPYTKVKSLNYLDVLKVASWQITFLRKRIIEKNIYFDETVGSGVSHAGGEEILFLYQCLKKGLKIYSYPVYIAELISGSPSQWFNNKYTKEYFQDRGIFTAKLMGKFLAVFYGLYFLSFKYNNYKRDISFTTASGNLLKGILSV